MRVTFDMPEAAAERLKQLANANGIPAGAEKTGQTADPLH